MNIETSPRSIVSYFEHEKSPKYNVAKDLADIENIGFNHVVLCVSEVTMNNPKRLQTLHDNVITKPEDKLVVWADPWGVGKLFGGEGESEFAKTGEKPCICNDHFNQLMYRWINQVKEIGVDGIFWDEPELRCDDHSKVDVIKKYTEYAKQLGLFNSVCLTADPRRVDDLEKIAELASVDDIGTDPYWPNAFYKIPKDKRIDYVREWTQRTGLAAARNDKTAHIWIQGFDIDEGDTRMISEFADTVRKTGVPNVAFWGYKGCASLFGPREGKATSEDVWKEAITVFSNSKTIPVFPK